MRKKENMVKCSYKNHSTTNDHQFMWRAKRRI